VAWPAGAAWLEQGRGACWQAGIQGLVSCAAYCQHCGACGRVLRSTGRGRGARRKGRGGGEEERAGSDGHWPSSAPCMQCSMCLRACPSSWQELGGFAATKQGFSKPMHRARWLLMHHQGPQHCLAYCWLVTFLLRGAPACPMATASPAASSSTHLLCLAEALVPQ